MSRFALVVVAGGDSRRMRGKHKALLPVPPDQQALINHIVEKLAPLAQAGVVVVANNQAVQASVAERWQARVDIVPDRWPGTGTLGGVATGLLSCTDWAIVTACDMPFLVPALFVLLCRLARETDAEERRKWDAVVPLVHGHPQMLHSLYHVSMLPVFQRRIHADELKFVDALPGSRVRYVSERELTPLDPSLRSFTNVNTPEEWDAARTELAAAINAQG